MRSFVLALSLMAALGQTACSNLPVQTYPVSLNPVQRPAQFMPAQVVPAQLGLNGAELELSGIYIVNAHGASLILRNGQELRLLNLSLQPLTVLPGIPDRMQVRVRGILRPGGEMTLQQPLALQVAGVSRVHA